MKKIQPKLNDTIKVGFFVLIIFVAMLIANRSMAAEIREIAENISKFNPKLKDSHDTAYYIVKYAKEYGIDAKLLHAIIAVESSYKIKAYNKMSKDYGLTQINSNTIKAYNLDKYKLMHDKSYSIKNGAMILSYFKKRYFKSEPATWYCRYNVGTAKLEGNLAKSCIKYLNKINKYYKRN